jgi:hypothetical protein
MFSGKTLVKYWSKRLRQRFGSTATGPCLVDE